MCSGGYTYTHDIIIRRRRIFVFFFSFLKTRNYLPEIKKLNTKLKKKKKKMPENTVTSSYYTDISSGRTVRIVGHEYIFHRNIRFSYIIYVYVYRHIRAQ